MIDAAGGRARRSGRARRPGRKLETEALAPRQRSPLLAPVVLKIKEAINRAYESSLSEGLLFERRGISCDVCARGPEGRHARILDKRKPRSSTGSHRGRYAAYRGSVRMNNPHSNHDPRAVR